jgi:hypothetical protein
MALATLIAALTFIIVGVSASAFVIDANAMNCLNCPSPYNCHNDLGGISVECDPPSPFDN